MMQPNEDFTFDRITKNYNKYFHGPKENETKYEEIYAEKNETEWQKMTLTFHSVWELFSFFTDNKFEFRRLKLKQP